MNDRSRSISDFLAGVIFGMTIGFVVALLLAPREGTEARDKLKRGAMGALDNTKGVVDEVQDRIQRAVEEGRQAAAETRAELEASTGLPHHDGDSGRPTTI